MELKSIIAPIMDDLRLVEARLKSASDVPYPELSRLLAAIVAAGGKRLRPAILLMAARLGNYDLERLLPMATAVELLHTATLIHDDTIDGAFVRRGTPTLNSAIAIGPTVLIGDFLFAQSAVMCTEPGDIRAVRIFAQSLATICDGELTQLFEAHRLDQTREDYYRRIYSKTAALFAAAAELGAVLSDASEEHITALREYGCHLGMAFQIVDDVLDFRATERELGKPVGNDLRQGHVTLPVLAYLEHHDGGAGRELLRAVVEGEASGHDGVEAAVATVVASGAVDLALSEAVSFARKAKAALPHRPNQPYLEALAALADYAVDRPL